MCRCGGSTLTNYEPLPETRVIGFGHRAQAGKDVAARAIASRVLGARLYAFSDAISVYCRVARGMTARDPGLLQAVGYELRRQNPQVWLDCLYWRIKEDAPTLGLITGVRFPNEVEMIRGMGGAVWRIDRLNADGSAFVADDRPHNHPTETALAGERFDAVLKNRAGAMDVFQADAWRTFVDS